MFPFPHIHSFPPISPFLILSHTFWTSVSHLESLTNKNSLQYHAFNELYLPISNPTVMSLCFLWCDLGVTLCFKLSFVPTHIYLLHSPILTLKDKESLGDPHSIFLGKGAISFPICPQVRCFAINVPFSRLYILIWIFKAP